MVFQDTIKIAPHGKGSSDITELITRIIKDSKIKIGTCQLFVQNSKTCLLIRETANESTRSQTVEFLAQLAPSSDCDTHAIDESMEAIPDEMRTALLQTSLSFPINLGRPALGAWQGIFLWEVAPQPKERKLTITIIGE